MRWLPALLMLLVLGAAPAGARDWQVRMLNRGPDGAPMAFAPAFLAIQPGDTVRFLASDRGHNAESLPGMIPQGAAPFRGRINEEIVVRFTAPGLYGYKCLPHLGMGMVGLIQVGRATNRAEIAAAASRLPPIARARIAAALALAR